MIEYLKYTRELIRAQLKRTGLYDFVRIKHKEARYDQSFAEMNAKFDIFIVSYSNSGRNWHRVMLGYYLARLTGTPESSALDLDKLCRIAGLPRTKYTHNAAGPAARLPASSRVVASSDQWRSKKVLLLVREPKAVLVSSFHHARFRLGFFDGSLSDFIRDPRFGIEKVATVYRRWHANRHLASVFDVVSYEGMHACPEGVLRKTIAFMGLAPDETIISEAVIFGRFENMRQYESANFFNSQRLRKRRADDRIEGDKVREGKTDSYKSHLTQEDNAYVDRRLAELGGNPFAAESALAPS